MISITEKAARAIRRMKEDEDADLDSFLRVHVEKGGCSGMSYKLTFTNEKKDNDKVFSECNETILVDPSSYLFIAGMTLDYSGGLNGQGFVFSNPNATKTCGCGSSFGVA
jgi:iron-sulfur cluster assembly protein